MRVPVLALLIGGAWLWSGHSAAGQQPKPEPAPPALVARAEVEEHEHCFTVRFFLKNQGEEDVEVVSGWGSSGLQVVPRFDVGGLTITPPTYLWPPRRSMRPMKRPIPAGKEILYGTFTMGYPPLNEDQDRVEDLSASIYFRELKATIRAEPQRLRIPRISQAD